MRFAKQIPILLKILPAVLIIAACIPTTPAPTAISASPTPAAAASPTAPAATSIPPTSVGTPTSAPGAPTRTTAEWQAVVLKAFAAQKQQPWRSESEILTAGGHSGHTTVEYVPPDRYHIISQPDTELILIGQQVYSKLNGQWSLAQISAASILGADAFGGLEQNIPGLQCASPEPLDGKPMHLCQYSSTARIGDSDEAVQNKLWIDAAANLPYQHVIDGAVGWMDTDTGQVTSVRATTTMRYTYDPALKIEPPQVAQ